MKDATALRDLTAFCLACKSHVLLGPPVGPAHLQGPQGQRELVELMRVEARAAMSLLEEDDGPRRNRSLAKSRLRLLYLDTMAQPCAGMDVRALE